MAEPGPDTEAFKHFQQARQLRATGESRHYPEIIRLCRQAVEAAPAFAKAWALMATCQTWLGFDSAPGEDGSVAADKALSLDPNLAEAHAVKARLMLGAGRDTEVKALVDRALMLDPDSFDVNAVAARYFISVKDYGKALMHLGRAQSLMELDAWALGMSLQCHEARGDNAGARIAADQAMKRIDKILAGNAAHGDALAFGVTTLIRLGRSQKAQDWAERALKADPDSLNLKYNMACAMVQLGKFDRAVELLEPVADRASRQGIEWFKVDTDLDPIRKSPRFKAMLEKAEARLATAKAS